MGKYRRCAAGIQFNKLGCLVPFLVDEFGFQNHLIAWDLVNVQSFWGVFAVEETEQFKGRFVVERSARRCVDV